MFKVGDVVRIKEYNSGATSWGSAFGEGVFDVVMGVTGLTNNGIVKTKVLHDPHNSLSHLMEVKIKHGDLYLEKNYYREELRKMKEELDV